MVSYIRKTKKLEEAMALAESDPIKYPSQVLNLYASIGAREESKGNKDIAIQWYRKGAEHPDTMTKHAGAFCRFRLQALEWRAPLAPGPSAALPGTVTPALMVTPVGHTQPVV